MKGAKSSHHLPRYLPRVSLILSLTIDPLINRMHNHVDSLRMSRGVLALGKSIGSFIEPVLFNFSLTCSCDLTFSTEGFRVRGGSGVAPW